MNVFQTLFEKALKGRTPKARIVILDRSRVEARQKCPYLRFTHYHAPVLVDGTMFTSGVMRRAAAVPLVTGSTVHHSLALMLQGADEDTAIHEANLEYDKIVANRGFSELRDTPLAWTIREQRALGEGLGRIANRRVVKKLMQNFEILDVEQEILAWLGDVDDDRGGVTFLWASRLDALMRDKSGMVTVLNWKTQKKWRDDDAEKLRLDMQTAGEAWAAQEFYDLAVPGVQYIFLLKGEQREDPEKHHKVTYNHLVRAWRTLGEMGTMKYAWAYYKEGTKQQVMSKASGFFPFEEFPGGIKGWIDALDEGSTILPLNGPDPFEALIRIPAAVSAGASKIERWREQTLRDEYRWLRDLEDGRPASKHESGFICGVGDWRCQMHDHCHQAADLADPKLYMPRDPNHPVEASIWGGD